MIKTIKAKNSRALGIYLRALYIKGYKEHLIVIKEDEKPI